MLYFCLCCGVCCVYFCVVFYWLEVELFFGGEVFVEFIVKFDLYWLVMCGIEFKLVCCVVL